MVPIHIAENEEPCAGDQTKYAAHWTVEELREAGLIESFVPAHGGLLFVVPLRRAMRISGMRMRCRGPAAVASGLRAQVKCSRNCDHQPASNPLDSTPANQAIVRKAPLTAALERVKPTGTIEVKQIDFAPGQKTGVHDHPCPVVGYVVSGSVSFQIEGEPPRTLHASEAFFEPPGKIVLHFDNASSTQPMTFIAFYLLGAGETELIRMLTAPGRS
jgi:quercetin dioxygenase-like cupin family protein